MHSLLGTVAIARLALFPQSLHFDDELVNDGDADGTMPQCDFQGCNYVREVGRDWQGVEALVCFITAFRLNLFREWDRGFSEPASDVRCPIGATPVDDVDAGVDVSGIVVGQCLHHRDDVLFFHLVVEIGIDDGVKGKIKEKWYPFFARQRTTNIFADVGNKLLLQRQFPFSVFLVSRRCALAAFSPISDGFTYRLKTFKCVCVILSTNL